MSRELHLLAFGGTRSAGPWRHPEVDNSTAAVRGTFDALFIPALRHHLGLPIPQRRERSA